MRYHIEDISPVLTGTDIIVKNLFCPVDKRGFLHGAGGGGRTRTVSPPRDFESRTSASSITPAYQRIKLYHKAFIKSTVFSIYFLFLSIFLIIRTTGTSIYRAHVRILYLIRYFSPLKVILHVKINLIKHSLSKSTLWLRKNSS